MTNVENEEDYIQYLNEGGGEAKKFKDIWSTAQMSYHGLRT